MIEVITNATNTIPANAPYSDGWRREQLRTIGGSTAATCIGMQRFRDKAPQRVWDRMRALLVTDELPPPLAETPDLRRGTLFESLARSMLAEKLQVSVVRHDQGNFVHNRQMPWAHALPDAWIGSIPVEIKVPRPATVAKVNLIGIFPEWRAQCIHTAAICGAPFAWIAILDPVQAFVHDYQVLPNDGEAAFLMLHEREFWESVQRGSPRPDDPVPLEQVADGESAQRVLDSPEAVDAAWAWFDVRDLQEDADEARQLARDRLVKLADGAEVFEVAGVGRFWYRANKAPRQFDRDKALARLREALGADYNADDFYKAGTPSRPFCGYRTTGD